MLSKNSVQFVQTQAIFVISVSQKFYKQCIRSSNGTLQLSRPDVYVPLLQDSMAIKQATIVFCQLYQPILYQWCHFFKADSSQKKEMENSLHNSIAFYTKKAAHRPKFVHLRPRTFLVSKGMINIVRGSYLKPIYNLIANSIQQFT